MNAQALMGKTVSIKTINNDVQGYGTVVAMDGTLIVIEMEGAPHIRQFFP